jgi:hypothetical protein
MKVFLVLITLLLLSFHSCRKSDYILEDTEFIRDNGNGTGTITWTSDRTYIIDGLVFVNDGQTLSIEAGTVIKGNTSSKEYPSALVVSRGGKIIAQGTPNSPIIFTSIQDEPVGSLSIDKRGLWGGVIILGNASIHSSTGEAFIEGIPISEPRGLYGGPNDEDNSGIFSYVSIRHAGIDIGEENEINGLTLGGVGRKTRIDHVEVISSNDDGFEFFGGTVSCKNLAAAFCKDDAFDFDEGYSGKLQFLLGIKSPEDGDCLAEHSDYPSPFPVKPVSYPEIYNASFIGNAKIDGVPLIRFFKNGAGIYRNSLFLNSFEKIHIEYTVQSSSSYTQFTQNKIQVNNNLLDGSEDSMIVRFTPLALPQELEDISSQKIESWNNDFKNPGLEFDDFPYKLLPTDTQFDSMAPYDYPWYDNVSFKGAFGSNNWLENWSYLWRNNLIR